MREENVMKTLNTIQKLAKIGKIISKIIFIFSIIGLVGCIAGIICLAVIPEGFKIGGLTVNEMVKKSGDVSVNTCYTAMAMGILLCAGEAVISKISEIYFKHELSAGTPFTFEGAKELLRFGICAIAVPIGTSLIAQIVYVIMSNALKDVADLNLNNSVSAGLGIVLIVVSLLCKYGAEISQNTEQKTK